MGTWPCHLHLHHLISTSSLIIAVDGDIAGGCHPSDEWQFANGSGCIIYADATATATRREKELELKNWRHLARWLLRRTCYDSGRGVPWKRGFFSASASVPASASGSARPCIFKRHNPNGILMLNAYSLHGAELVAWLEKPVFPVMTFGVVLLSLPLPLQVLPWCAPLPRHPTRTSAPFGDISEVPLSPITKDQVYVVQVNEVLSLFVFVYCNYHFSGHLTSSIFQSVFVYLYLFANF